MLKPAVFVTSLAPVGDQTWALVNRPIAVGSTWALERTTGDWALVFLCLTLAVTPARRLTSWHVLVRFRRMLGLFVFFYGTLHFVTYLLFD